MRPVLVALVADLTSVFPKQHLSGVFELAHENDVDAQIIEKLHDQHKTSPEELAVYMGECLGKLGVFQILQALGVTFDRGSPVQALIEIWFQQHEIAVTKPAARPQETADAIAEISSQISVTPGLFDATKLLLPHCERLMRYLAAFYASELVADPAKKRLLEEKAAPSQTHGYATALQTLNFGDLCAFVTHETPVRAEPYKASCASKVALTTERVKGALSTLMGLADRTESEDRASLSMQVSECVGELLDHWRAPGRGGIVPKGAVVLSLDRLRFDTPATCCDESSQQFIVTGIMAPISEGDNVLLSIAETDNVCAPKLKTLPREEAWTTPLSQSVRNRPAAPSKRRDQIFVSYSHKNKKWVDRLRTHLKPLKINGTISEWADSEIEPGDKWQTEIKKAIQSARLAVLLVTPDFLASDFIMKEELPPLIRAAEQGLVKILWIAVRKALYRETELAKYEALNEPDRPLDSLSEKAREMEFVRIAEAIGKAARER